MLCQLRTMWVPLFQGSTVVVAILVRTNQQRFLETRIKPGRHLGVSLHILGLCERFSVVLVLVLDGDVTWKFLQRGPKRTKSTAMGLSLRKSAKWRHAKPEQIVGWMHHASGTSELLRTLQGCNAAQSFHRIYYGDFGGREAIVLVLLEIGNL